MKVTILRGLPGSGKSTWANSEPGGYVCSADHWFDGEGGYRFVVEQLGDAHAFCRAEFEHSTGAAGDCCPQRKHVIVDNTNVTNKEMKFYVELALARGYGVEIREFKDNFGSIHNVPQEKIDRMWKRWEAVKPEWEKYLVKG